MCWGSPGPDDRLALKPLHHASQNGSLGVHKLLINAGASLLVEESKATLYDVHHFYEYNTGRTDRLFSVNVVYSTAATLNPRHLNGTSIWSIFE